MASLQRIKLFLYTPYRSEDPVDPRCRTRSILHRSSRCGQQLVLLLLLLISTMSNSGNWNALMQTEASSASAPGYNSSSSNNNYTGNKTQPSRYLFYLHMTIFNPAVENTYFTGVYGPSPLPASISNPTNFGVVTTFEAPLTLAPSNASAPAGTGQGIYVFDSLKGLVLFHVFTATIDDGARKGTVCLMGQMVESDAERILTVVGGTGDFLLARGFATNRLVELVSKPAPARWTLSFDLHLYYD